MFKKTDWLHSFDPLTAAGWIHGWSDGDGPDFKSPTQGPAHQKAMKELCRKAGLHRAAEVLAEACTRLGPGAAVHFHDHDGRIILDLWSANSDQMVQAGIDPGRIHWSERCTICGSPAGDLSFPSYRRQGELAGRFAAIIGFTG